MKKGDSKKKNASRGKVTCSFCETKRVLGDDIFLGPHGAAICTDCAKKVVGMFDLSGALPICSQKQRTRPEFLKKLSALTPGKIKAELDKCVVGQEEAKKVLSVAVYNHYRRIAAEDNPVAIDDEELKDVAIEKSNIILTGPTGSGKTLFAKTIAKMLDVPFAIADATTFTEAGYVGEDVENIVRYLWINAGCNAERAAMGIVMIDEADKIAAKSQNVSITRDVSGEGVQQALLKIVEGTTCRFTPEGGRKHPETPLVEVDTRNILFIACGAFVGIDDIIRRRKGQNAIGFGVGADEGDERRNRDEILPEDLVRYGLIPELVGRFPIVTQTFELTEAQLMDVLVKPRNAITKQYRKLLAQSGIRLKFGEDALRKFAREAIERKTGARGLRAEIEKRMLDVMFTAPDECKAGDVIEVLADAVKICHAKGEIPNATTTEAA